jgi:hypothetical protein
MRSRGYGPTGASCNRPGHVEEGHLFVVSSPAVRGSLLSGVD